MFEVPVIFMKKNLDGVIKQHLFLSPGNLQRKLDAFSMSLSEAGYSLLTIRGYYDSISHFGYWLQKKSIPIKKINNRVVSDFSKHYCSCPGARRGHKISRKYTKRVQRFVTYLYRKNTNSTEPKSQKIDSLLLLKFKDFLSCRGLSQITIKGHQGYMLKIFSLIGKNPKKYNPVIIRQMICDISKKFSLAEVKKIITVLRAYIRFLAIEGKCHPRLAETVPSVAYWKNSSMPKYLEPDDIKRVINSCNTNTKHGLRDHAILLLLVRLGLRASDVSNMLWDDINWQEGTIVVRGKNRRATILPLPQEVGDALLAYLKKGRPKTDLKQVFLCFNAPFRPFSTSSGISSVVNSSLLRAGVVNPPSHGANLLRHSAATALLREGSSLESISALLRHSSLNMTGYYAKVDVNMLKKIAQPWPKGAPC